MQINTNTDKVEEWYGKERYIYTFPSKVRKVVIFTKLIRNF